MTIESDIADLKAANNALTAAATTLVNNVPPAAAAAAQAVIDAAQTSLNGKVTAATTAASNASTSAGSAATSASNAAATLADTVKKTELSAADGTSQVGYKPGYPGAGWIAGDLGEVIDEHVSVKRLGVSSTQSGSVNTDKLQAAFVIASQNRLTLELPFEDLTFAGPVFQDSTMVINQAGVSLVGQATRVTRLNYTGTGFLLNYTGLGLEGGTPLTQFDLRNFRITGGNNSVSTGGIYLDRVNRVKLYGVSVDSFASAGARLIEIRNFFNVELEKFNLSSGGSLPQGQYGLVYGSKESASGVGDFWNSSNLRVHNGLIQRNAGKGAVAIHDGNILDNVEFSHVSFGANSNGSVSAVSDKMHNLGIHNCHFESSGTQSDGSFVPSTHVYTDQVSGVELTNSEFKDAATHVHLHRTKGFVVEALTIFESGAYTIPAAVGIDISGDATTSSLGRIGPNNIYTNQIDTPYRTDAYSSVDPGARQVTESAWTSVYAGQPGYYGKSLLIRRELNTGNPDGQFDQAWLAPQASWLRVMLSTRHVGWGTTFPTTGSYTQGDIVLNEAPTVLGTTPYTTLGWRRLTTGSTHVAGTDWVSLRCLSGLPAFTSSYNGGEPLKLGGYYLWIDSSGRLRVKSGAPTSDTDGAVVGTQT